jgi:hypothetical protein
MPLPLSREAVAQTKTEPIGADLRTGSQSGQPRPRPPRARPAGRLPSRCSRYLSLVRGACRQDPLRDSLAWTRARPNASCRRSQSREGKRWFDQKRAIFARADRHPADPGGAARWFVAGKGSETSFLPCIRAIVARWSFHARCPRAGDAKVSDPRDWSSSEGLKSLYQAGFRPLAEGEGFEPSSDRSGPKRFSRLRADIANAKRPTPPGAASGAESDKRRLSRSARPRASEPRERRSARCERQSRSARCDSALRGRR